MRLEYVEVAAKAIGCPDWVMSVDPSPGYCNRLEDHSVCWCREAARAVLKLHDQDIKKFINQVMEK